MRKTACTTSGMGNRMTYEYDFNKQNADLEHAAADYPTKQYMKMWNLLHSAQRNTVERYKAACIKVKTDASDFCLESFK